MQKLGPIVLVLVLTWALGDASAQVDADHIGVYFDEAATQNSAFAEPWQAVQAYLVASNLSLPGNIVYWEALVSATGNVHLLHGSPRGGGVDSWMDMPTTPTEFMAVWYTGEPFPVTDDLVLAVLNIELLGSDEACEIFIEGISESYPLYQLSTFESPTQPMFPSSGDVALPVARINGEAPVPTFSRTWGSVKGLYH